MRFMELFPLAAAVVAADDSPCSCGRTAALEDEVATLKREMRELRFLATELQPLKRLLAAAEAKTMEAVTVDTESGTVASVEVGRRLSSAGSTYVSVPSRQVHAFPAGHLCERREVQGYLESGAPGLGGRIGIGNGYGMHHGV